MPASPRFLTLADVAEVLNTSSAQVYALVRRGELPAIKIGGRGQWRVESEQLEQFIQRMYAETRTFVDEHPFVDSEATTEP
jgi:excisionase family DNA binding protein